MVGIVSELELTCIDGLSRQELIQSIRDRASDLPPDLLRRLEDQTTDRLQLLLLAGRVLQVLRRVWFHG